ncbi:hypothetical protein A11A3_05986 [Alcanivorax hongdengensis A-11-3]|uniref:CSLREA domain-containing protein n=1 Tax=Alcanivorax hongdengensis A-11-3 TaxID=1177179 RepID=L0WGP0_9GAMM|nr:right-handed parallel beta-helix repeat-containing protein [Alcanivorax hongdengensis]EKF74980.1 hypothetical protein A11A3_05986 [Alcanivorax hongdengensis A-11-3]
MRYPGLRLCLAGCAFLFAATSHATTYDIDTTSDVAIPEPVREGSGEDMVYGVHPATEDGKCSLREALYAIAYQTIVDGCEAGTGSDVIKLQEDKVYTLTEGQLPVGGGKKVKFDVDNSGEEPVKTPVSDPANDTAISPIVTIQLALDSFEEADDKVKPQISAAGNSRLILLNDGATLTLTNLTLTDGNAASEMANNGGLIHASSTLTLGEGTELQNGTAANGGAIYMDAGSALTFTSGSRFDNNTASGNGSVIATSDTFDGAIIGYQFYMAGNMASATGGTVYLDGEPDTDVYLGMTNGTITGNDGGVIKVVAAHHYTAFQNMTIAFNGGVALDIPASVFDDPADEETTDQILHTALIGNDSACAGSALDDSTADDTDARLLYTITDDSNCPQPQEGVPVTDQPNMAQSDVLTGADNDGNRLVCDPSASGIGACKPLPAESLGGPFPGFLPTPDTQISGYDPMDPAATASLFNRASPQNVTSDLCADDDMRGQPRGGAGGRCDVGAVEFLRGLAQADEIEMISGTTSVGDVLDNDRNDAEVDCSLVPSGKPCLNIFVAPAKGSAIPVYRCKNPSGETVTAVSVQVPTCPDPNDRIYPYIQYTPASSFHGVDTLRYEVAREAFIGGADADQDQNALTNFVADPASGLTDSDSIGGGPMAPLALLGMLLAGLWRRHRLGVSSLLLLASVSATAADIKVDSLTDTNPPVTNDGVCSLREAVNNAAGANPSPDCEFGDKGSDQIILPAGDIQLVASLQVSGGGVTFVGKGARDDDSSDDDDTLTRLLGDGSFRLVTVTAPVSSGYPGVTFRYLSLENGHAAGSGDDGLGGVILTGGSVSFDRVVLRNNQADVSGGVAYILSNAGNDKDISFDRTYATGNSAGEDGGVLSTVTQNAERVDLSITNSTFESNSAVDRGGVLDPNLVKGATALVSNSTFFNNSAPNGSALDLDGLAINTYLLNLTLVSNTGGNGLELGDSSAKVTLSNSIIVDSGAACSSGSGALSTSVFNLFSAAECAVTSEGTSSDNTANSADASLFTATLQGEQDGASSYLPPYLPVADPAAELSAATPLVVNAGSDEDLASGTSSPTHCRSTDLRGVARNSGDRCDRGAYEYQQITAGDDEGDNSGTPDRRVLIDIFDNDLPSDGAEIQLVDTNVDPADFLSGRLAFENAEAQVIAGETEVVGTGETFTQDPDIPSRYTLSNGAMVDLVWRYYNESVDGYDVRCGQPLPQAFIDANDDDYSDGDVAKDCVLLYTPADNGKIANASDPSKDNVCLVNDDTVDQDEIGNQPNLYLLYQFTDNASPAQTSDQASVTMTLSNKAPKITGQTVVNQPGQKVVFTVKATDPDGDDSSINWNTLRVKDEPSFSKRNPNTHQAEGVGVIVDTVKHQVTYIPDSNFQTFKDTFTMVVDDNCGGTSKTATFTITYPHDDASAGSGSFGAMMLGILLLLFRRRRFSGL